MPLTRITVTVPPDLVRRADRLARHQGASRSSVFAQALAAHLAALEDSPTYADRVAEPAGKPYDSGSGAPLATVDNDVILAELGRRLGTGRTHTAGAKPIYDRATLEEICRRHHIRRLSVFGSVLRGDFGPESDVDVLVEFEPGHTPGLAIQDIEDALSAVFGGRRVDLVTEQSLHPLIRDRVLENAVVQYAA